jgi:23S rRNA pseudouridine2605 synthase
MASDGQGRTSPENAANDQKKAYIMLSTSTLPHMSKRRRSRDSRGKPQSAQQGREGIRINRFLSMCGITSRRKAETLILEGKVEVNHKLVRELSTKVDPAKDKVYVNGGRVLPVEDHVYLVLNKPKDAITTLSDERGRTTVMSMVKTKYRVYPVGRLDRNTTGVLLFTNDGDFAHRLTHPKFEVPKTYRVTCAAPVHPRDLQKMERGMELEDGKTAPAEIYVIPGGKGKDIGITIHEGRNRQVRRMFEELGYEVLKLDRAAYGPVTHTRLVRGETRSLTKAEIRGLKTMAGYTDEEQWRSE